MAYEGIVSQNVWTPVVVGGTAPGVGTYTLQAGLYSVLQGMVFVFCEVAWSAHTGTGSMSITGLPLPCKNSFAYTPQGVYSTSSIVLPAGTVQCFPRMLGGDATLYLLTSVDNAVNESLQMDGSGRINISMFYFI